MLVICRIFSPEEDCEVIESEKHSHVFYQAETDIWMVLVMTFHYFNTFFFYEHTGDLHVFILRLEEIKRAKRALTLYTPQT